MLLLNFAISGIGRRRTCTEADAHMAQCKTEVSTN
jgi:hypothetical protein